MYDVSKPLDHSDVSMTHRYTHMVDDSLQKATDNMAGVIERAVDMPSGDLMADQSANQYPLPL